MAVSDGDRHSHRPGISNAFYDALALSRRGSNLLFYPIPNITQLRFHSLRLNKLFGLALFAFFVIAVAGCAKRASDRALPPQDEAWTKARHYFQRRKFYHAQQLLKDFVLNYSGSTPVDSAQYYLGCCTFEMDDYLTAAEEFKRVVSQYPFSKLVGDAAYWEARCYFEQSPSYQLDQTYTTQALDAFQRFLEDYSDHVLTDSAYKYISLCRNKLARKEFAATKLYYDLGEFASAILYCEGILSNYYDTQWAEPAQYVKARSFEALGNRPRARQEYLTYLEKYPSGKHAESARRAVAALSDRGPRQSSLDVSP